MDKINVFWIEDNPIQDDVVEIGGVKYPSFRIREGGEFFSFKIFQHPVEVQEYLAMIHLVKELGHAKKLGETCLGAVPEIVVFDYKLSDNFTTSNPRALQYNHSDQCHFIRDHSATLELKRCFAEEFAGRLLFFERPEVTAGNYDSDEFKTAIGVDTLTLDDEFGLFAGITILREFKDFITLGVPATFNKADRKAMSPNASFHEWINSYDLEDVIRRPKKESKNWNDILRFALPLLRRRLETQIQNGKIIPQYDQLIQLADGLLAGGFISFISAYGQKKLPLDGLFSDEPQENRTQKISAWAKLLITALPGSGAEIRKAIDVSDELWRVFTRDFGRRIDLSNLAYWERESDRGLTPGEQTVFAKLKKDFGVENGEIKNHTCSIQKLFPKKTNKVDFTIRLTVLHLATRAAINMNKCRDNASNKAIYRELDEYEYFNLLFPIVSLKDDMILPMHKEDDKDDLVEQGRNWAYRKLGTTQGDWLNFEKWITPGEKSLLRSIYFAQDEYYPDWLKQ